MIDNCVDRTSQLVECDPGHSNMSRESKDLHFHCATTLFMMLAIRVPGVRQIPKIDASNIHPLENEESYLK
jgi:hypothetical protein